MKAESLSIRPYARLLTMLGDQLIKNERIALVELIKNAYDADADRVEVRFDDFNEDMTRDERSRIVVRDNGSGMTPEIVRTQWMNPAAPHKYLDKRQGREKTPGKNRVIQGEKGIGRFAILKLGKVITVTTRAIGAEFESVIAYDCSRFDDDFVVEDGRRKEIFLDQIEISCWQSEPNSLAGDEHGTVIDIQRVKGVWNDDVIEKFCYDVSNLTDPVSRVTGRKTSDLFEINVFCNGEVKSVEADSMEEIKRLVEDKRVLNIRGCFRSHSNSFCFQTDAVKEEVSLDDSKITGLWMWRQRFKRARDDAAANQRYACGDFRFQFYIFDFARRTAGRYALTQVEKDLLKKHRIYLYRDDMRVYPYGDPDDDWLSIDATRGTGRAGDFFSNDQTIGWIDITHRDNPNLRDKTSREGLIESGGAAGDLIFLVQAFLSYLKQYPYARHQQKERQRSTAQLVRDEAVARRLAQLKDGLEKSGSMAQVIEIGRIEAEYKREKEYLSQRADITEDLAGVGLSVEMALHDIMILMNRAQDIGKRLARMAQTAGDQNLRAQADMLVGVLQQISDGMQNVQSLFKSARRRRKILKIEPVLDKVYQLFKPLLEKRDVFYKKVSVGSSALTANISDGVVMLVLINLFDNASYWLDTEFPDAREIRVTVDGDRGELGFSDSGPGIAPEDLPFIFEPFYSGKGEEGRGLGLYIARQLLERYGYRIAASAHNPVLTGANFVVSFVKEDA